MSFYNILVGQLSRVQDSTSEGAASLQDVVRLSNAAGLATALFYEGGSVVLSADLFLVADKPSPALVMTFFGQDALEHEEDILEALKAGDASSIPVEMVTVTLVTAGGSSLLDWDSSPSTTFSFTDIDRLVDAFCKVVFNTPTLAEAEKTLDDHLGWGFERTDYRK